MAAHRNLSNRATDSGVVIGEGEFRRVTLGHYTEGPRISEKCVMKAFKSGGVYEDTFFSDDIKASESAIETLQAFSTHSMRYCSIRINKPEVWRYTDGPKTGQKHLVTIKLKES